MSTGIEKASIRGSDGIVEFDVSQRMEGGMKHVYFTRDRTGVVAFFKDTTHDFHRYDRLKKVIYDFNPTRDGRENADYWRDLFCWPTRLVEHKAFGVGAQLPAYPQCFFFSMGPLAGKEKDG